MYKSSMFLTSPELAPFIYLVVAIDLVLKAITLYKSAGREQKIWFVALLVINSMGILPIIYLLINKDVAFKSSKVAKKGK